MIVRRFQDLDVYKLSFELQQTVFDLTKTFPKEETYSLTDQVRRASRSIGANIAEAWRKRHYPAHFRSKLTDADAENAETQHWLTTALACGYIEQPTLDNLIVKSETIGSKLGNMISNAEKWKPH